VTDLGTARPHIASYIIFRKNNSVALLLRANTSWMKGHYGLPAGKVEENESFVDCALREAEEEVGVKINKTDLVFVHVMHRKSDEGMYWVDTFFEAKRWPAELFNAEPEIHGELAWFALGKPPKNIVPNVRYALEQIEKGSAYSEYGW
jgi:8-oxo-dGTP diphosphatase